MNRIALGFLLAAILGWQEWRIYQLDQRLDQTNRDGSEVRAFTADSITEFANILSEHGKELSGLKASLTAVQDAFANSLIDKALSGQSKNP